MKELELCAKCANLLKESYAVKKIEGGVNQKVACQNCGRRRYGGRYRVEKQEK